MLKILCVLLFVGTVTSIDIADLSVDIAQDLILMLTGIEIDYTGKCPPFNGTDIKFLLYNQNHRNISINLTAANLNEVDPKLDTKIVIHGWIAGANESRIIEMKDAYLQNGLYNVILVDWSKYAYLTYAESFCEVPKIGVIVGDLILSLQEQIGFNLNNTHIIGHSLGAQISGYAGRAIISGGKKVGRITGLDAAGPGYYHFARAKDETLSKNDAYFVDAIHTNDGFLGYNGAYGTVDFYPNCGSNQAGCLSFTASNSSEKKISFPDLGCSHVRSITYFTESISSYDFIAHYCPGCISNNLGFCKHNEELLMGEHSRPPINEDKNQFYLNTNKNLPYARGA